MNVFGLLAVILTVLYSFHVLPSSLYLNLKNVTQLLAIGDACPWVPTLAILIGSFKSIWMNWSWRFEAAWECSAHHAPVNKFNERGDSKYVS